MADPILSVIFQQLATIIDREIEQEVRLVVGVEKEVQKLRSNLHSIEAVLEDAEKRKSKDSTVKAWLAKLKDVSYDIDDVLDEWSTAIAKTQVQGTEIASIPRKARSLISFPCISCNQTLFRRDIALKIKELDERLAGISREKDLFNFSQTRNTEVEECVRPKSTSFLDVFEVRGRDEDKSFLLSKLLSESSNDSRYLQIVSIVGMAGIGKTTLAQLVYNDNEVLTHFDERIWVSVSYSFDEVKVAKAILESLKIDAPNSGELQTHLLKIHETIKSKKFFLVLDDVWTDDSMKWEQLYNCLSCGAQGSRVLVTTRKETVAYTMGSTHRMTLKTLSEQDCWSLFSRIAFFGGSDKESQNLEDIGRSIAAKCKGLPLAAKCLGSLLRFERSREQWQRVLDTELCEHEEMERGIFSSLLLSYYDLSSILRRCFSYCAVFHKGYVIEKDNLIMLWMAQGYLKATSRKGMEIVGKEYFDKLAMSSFFQDFELDKDGSVVTCRMHDIMHDFAQFLTKAECLLVEVTGGENRRVKSSSANIRHSTMMLEEVPHFPFSYYRGKKLRSLFVKNSGTQTIVTGALDSLFDRLTCLRTLDLSFASDGGSRLETLPREIGKLIHLRYLNLSNQHHLKEIPESICDLFNLQTLSISNCWHLQNLPSRIGKLINLRHLDNYFTFLLSMPKGLGRLTSLQTLKVLLLSEFYYNGDEFTLGDLKNLNNLQGTLTLNGLGNVVDVEDAMTARLKNKNGLTDLGLDFDGSLNNDCEVLEALEPPRGLKRLWVGNYKGTTMFPSWIMALTNLKAVSLTDCCNCKNLPPFGKLLFLESLYISKMDSVENVGAEFLGIDVDGATEDVDKEITVAFPSLKKLRFSEMEDWKEWECHITSTTSVMPNLCSLKIYNCPKVRAVPDHLLQKTQLQKLYITSCTILSEHYKMETGEGWSTITHIPNFIIL